MVDEDFTVVRAKDGWEVETSRRRLGPFQTQEQATVLAVKLCREAAGVGFASAVLIRDAAGRSRAIPAQVLFGTAGPAKGRDWIGD
ncbi:hypothetical protein BZG35_16550 [Brevundimonas sp. LM2]|nr:hypothetical protein BZG35_16550 [Brevundimonas sp. LM2]